MGCESCSNKNTTPKGCRNNGYCATDGCNKLSSYNWLTDMEESNSQVPFDCLEARFKNGRKDFFRTNTECKYFIGDIVAVETSSTGYDVGVVSLRGELVRLQMYKKKVSHSSSKILNVKRQATEKDIEKWKNAQKKEKQTMQKAREIAKKHMLKMKISDVEYQGDNTRAIFYYTADQRVDFRLLIKEYASAFKIKIEMKQVGSRQEASRVGGIGSCGRELCCSTWLTDFRTVNTSAARYQQLSINPQKITGQCGKLKCCLNYELESYMDALKKFPKQNLKLKTKQGDASFQKMDIFKNLMWYKYEKETPGKRKEWVELTVSKVNEIINKNEKGITPFALEDFEERKNLNKEFDYENVVGQDSLTRFDKKKKKHKPKRRFKSVKKRK